MWREEFPVIWSFFRRDSSAWNLNKMEKKKDGKNMFNCELYKA